MGRKRARPEIVEGGGFSTIPWDVQDSWAFQGASHTARSLLYEAVRQHDGYNNGHIHLAEGWLRNRGWRSGPVVRRARDELLERRLLVQTRMGDRTKPHWYALTWHIISNFVGLDVGRAEYQRGGYRLIDATIAGRGSARSVRAAREKANAATIAKALEKRERYVSQERTGPSPKNAPTPPGTSSKNAICTVFSIKGPSPKNDDVSCHSPPHVLPALQGDEAFAEACGF